MISIDKAKDFFYRTFDIRKGELRRTFLMQLSIFLLISTLLIIKPSINSLFLINAGIENLPIAFILVAVFAGILTTFYSRLLNKIPLNRIIHYTLVISVICILLFTVLLKLNIIDVWILYVFYVWVAIFAVLATSQFWILANIIFNTREAKRLFNLIGGAAIAGGIFGGYLTSILAPFIGSENLLFIGAFFLVVCIFLIRMIWKSNKSTATSLYKRRKRMGRISEHPLRLIVKSKHLTYLALITAIGVFVARLVDYQFSAISSLLITDEDELTAFFGFWFSNINIISLLIQLFLTRRVVGTFGVGISLFFLPAGIFIGALSVLFFPALWSAILIKSADGSLKQSVNKSAIELLALPIPIETKNQAKTFIDVFVDSFATGMSGLILITLVIAFKLPVEVISLVIIALILLWFFYASRVRLEYVKLFKLKLNLNKEQSKETKNMPDLNKESVYGGLAKVLENGTKNQILMALRNTDDFQHEMLFIPIKKLLHHPSEEVVKEAIGRLYSYRSRNLSDEILPFTHHKSLAVRISAIEYIIEHSAYERKSVINRFLLDQDYHIKYATLLAIANETRDNPELKQIFKLSAIIGASIAEMETIGNTEEVLFKKKSVLKAIGSAHLDEFYPFMLEALNGQSAELIRAGIQSAGISLDELFIPVLYTFLLRKEFSADASAALANYGFKIITLLKEEVILNKANTDFVRAIPSVVERIGTQAGVDFMFELLNFDDIKVRSEAVRSLTVIKGQSPYLVFNKKQIINNIFDEAKLFQNILTALYVQQNRIAKPRSGKTDENIVFETRLGLIKLLEGRLDDNLDRIFKFLGLKYPQDEIDIAYQGLKSEKSELRISAIEFLDNLLEIHLKRILIPIIETSVEESVTKDGINELKIKDIGQAECFSTLLEGRDVTVKLAVLNLISVLNDKKFLPIVGKYVNHPNSKIALSANRTLEVLQNR